MKTTFTLKNHLTPYLLMLMIFLIASPVFGSVKHVVNVTNYKFTPNELQIEAGDTVEWQNTQGTHNINGNISTFPSNPESFGNSVGAGWTYQYVFNTPGKYDYHCDPHAAGGMKGKIEVSDGIVDDSKYNLTVNFTGMTPHEGENIWISLSNKNSGVEIERKKVVASVDFDVEFSGIEKNHSYNVDFFADHNENGSYDAPPVDHAWRMELNDVMGDTTLNFQHNTNFTDIMWKNKLTLHFMGMNPHVGENLQLAVIEKTSGMEIKRINVTAEVDFMVDVYGIVNGMSYNIDFFADHNENGSYDAPPVDHAWRMELNDVMGDTTLMFQHNTSFTDIMWKNELMVYFMGMNPHVGQNLQLAVIDKSSGMELQRISITATVDFMVSVFGIEKGKSYNIDFFADHNKNGMYDAPPADHAWRLELNDVMGDTMLMFHHNTSFTDIQWKNKLTVHFMGMNPHVGQNLQLAVTDKNSGMEIQRVDVTAAVDFMVDVYGIENGMSYNVDFFADHNKNGMYDAPPADHAWRIELNDVMGDTMLTFHHNTSFTDIQWKNKLTVHFMGMNPHVGQNLHLAVTDKSSGMEIQRVDVTAAVDFMVDVYGIENGMSYNVDFFADHNKNGMYDTPPADHAWRLELNDVMGDTMLTFHHNTSFTDIQWKNKLTVHFMGMNPHDGQNLHLAVIDKNSGMEIQRVSVTAAVDFMVDIYGIENGMSYNVDFFADHNNNGSYDAPPADHAWRLELNDVMGDTTLMFQHNTNFTDINWVATSVSELDNSSFKIYPNPATDRVYIETNEITGVEILLTIFDITGKLKYQETKSFNNRLEIDVRNLNSGIYFIDLRTNVNHKMLKLIKY